MNLNRTAQTLFGKIKNKKATVGIVGLGYVGLPLAATFVKKGFRVLGIDLDPIRIEAIRKGRSYVEDVPSREIRTAVQKRKLEVASSYEGLSKADVIVVCVPTPLNRAKDPDLSCILNAAEEIGSQLRTGQLVILESTTYPGTTEEVVLPTLQRSGLRVGQDFFLCFSPERIDPGNKSFALTQIPKVVGGITRACTELGSAFYGRVMEKVFPVSSARTAEMAKLLENTFRIVNIGLVNELARAAKSLGVNIWEAIEAARTKPFGFMAFYPGPGIGGHCIGVDPLYLSWKARVQGVDIHFIELARRINAEMPEFVVEQAAHTLNARSAKAVRGSKIMILGVSYKADVSDTRESPALDILTSLKKLGAKISYHDPHVPKLNHKGIELSSEALTPQTLRKKDLIIITTPHSAVDYEFVAKYARLIYDSRNVRIPERYASKVVRL